MVRVIAGLLVLACAGAGAAALAGDASGPPRADLSGFVFVANRTSPEIAVIDSASDTVVGRVEVRAVPRQYVISAALQKLAATHLADRAVSIADLAQGGLEVLDLGLVPEQLQIDAGGRLLAISSSRDGRVVLISLVTGKTLRTVA